MSDPVVVAAAAAAAPHFACLQDIICACETAG